MSRFRWPLFWTLAVLNLLALLTLLVIAVNRRNATLSPSLDPNAPGQDPIVETGPTVPPTVPPTVASATRPTAGAQPLPPVEGGSLELWHSWAGRDGDALAVLLDRFQQVNPHIRVQTRFVDYGDLARIYTEAVNADRGPDMLLAPGWWLRELASAKLLLPLEDWITPRERGAFISAAIANLTLDGTLYGLPTNYELVALYYNKRLIDQKDLPRNTDELVRLAQAAPSQGIGIYTNFYHLFWGIPAYGGVLFDQDGRVILETSNATADFLAWLLRAQPTPGIFAALDYGMLMERFKKEEFALFIDGPWSIPELRERFGADLAVAALPAGPTGPARPWLSADGVFLNPAATQNQRRLALALARHLTDAESASTLARVAGRLPANKNADLGGDPLFSGFMQQGNTALPLPHQKELEEVWGYANEMIAQTLNSAATPHQAVLQAASLINEANGK